MGAGSNKRMTPHRNEQLAQDDLLTEVEKELKELQRKVAEGEQPPTLMRSIGLGSNQTGVPMNDTQLTEGMHKQVQENSTFNKDMEELKSRLSELEDNMPEFKGANSWDVPIPLLKSTATLADAISAINKLIQRTTRQDRVK